MPSAVLFFDPIAYLWSGKPDLHSKQIILHLGSQIASLLKIFRSHSVRSKGRFSLRQFSNINRVQSKNREQLKSRREEQWGKMDQETSGTCWQLRQVRRKRQQLAYPFPRDGPLCYWHCIPQHHCPSFALYNSAQHNCFFVHSQDQSHAHLFHGSPKTRGMHTAAPQYKRLASTQVLVCYIGEKWGTFLTKSRYWLKLGQRT